LRAERSYPCSKPTRTNPQGTGRRQSSRSDLSSDFQFSRRSTTSSLRSAEAPPRLGWRSMAPISGSPTVAMAPCRKCCRAEPHQKSGADQRIAVESSRRTSALIGCPIIAPAARHANTVRDSVMCCLMDGSTRHTSPVVQWAAGHCRMTLPGVFSVVEVGLVTRGATVGEVRRTRVRTDVTPRPSVE
jgi:hypothetical protein